MSSLNKVILIGRLTAQPEMRYTQSGKAVATFTLAVDRNFKAEGKDKETDFITIVAWQRLAEICSQYLGKGRLVAIDGRLQTRSYTTNEGQKRKVYEVVAQDMRMLGRGKGDDGGAQSAPEDINREMSTNTGGDGANDFDNIGIQDLGMEDDVPF